jgi:hypothetical protein
MYHEWGTLQDAPAKEVGRYGLHDESGEIEKSDTDPGTLTLESDYNL